MAYVSGQLSLIADEVESGLSYWLYWTSDSLTAVLQNGYVSDAGSKRLSVGDIVDIFSGTVTNFSATSGGSVLGAVTFGPTVGITSRFQSTPQYARAIVSAVSAAGAATLQLVELPAGAFSAQPRNLLDGGDATVNPWQRGTSFSGIVATNTYTADRFFMVAGAASSASMVKTADTSVAGFSQSYVWGRAQSSGSVSAIVVGQALESLDSIRAQGQPVTFSFWARSNTGFAANGLQVNVVAGFGTDQSASALVNNTWTSAQQVVSSLQAISSTMTRYSFTGNVPNSATQLGVLLSYTPTNTTALANETVTMNGLQLEIGGLTPFEHRDVEMELGFCQRYFFQITETTSQSVIAPGVIVGTNSAQFAIATPVQMRAAPTVSVVSTGSFAANIVGTVTTLTGMAAGAASTPNFISVTGGVTAVSGQATLLVCRQPGSGIITASADL